MPEPDELTALLALERDQERRVAASLTAAERETDGTLDQPSAKDSLAHAIGAKRHMHDALIAHEKGTPRTRPTTAKASSTPTPVVRSTTSRTTPSASPMRSSPTRGARCADARVVAALDL